MDEEKKDKSQEEEEEEELGKLQERYADRGDLEKKWRDRLSEPPEDRMIDPKRKRKPRVVTR